LDISSDRHKHDKGPDGGSHLDRFTTNGFDQESFVLHPEDFRLSAVSDCRSFVPVAQAVLA
jgi:hypothetical protein